MKIVSYFFIKIIIFTLIFTAIADPLFANDDKKLESMIIGEWMFIAKRHELTITYKKDGTFTSDTETGLRKGTWKIQDGQLIENSKSGKIESKIKFNGRDSFTLDDVFTYERI